jgi:hypothetical protein
MRGNKEMNKNLKTISTRLAVSLLTLVVSGVALADDSTLNSTSVPAASQTSTAEVADTAAKAPSKFELTYFGIYLGPGLKNPGDSAQVNPSTGELDPTNWPQVLESSVKLSYNFSDVAFFGPVINFDNFPGQTDNSMMQDSGVRIGTKSLVKSKNFNVTADLRALAPISPAHIKAHTSVLYESVINAKYDIPSSKFSLGFLTFNKFHTYQDSGIGHLDAELYAGPNANWQFSQKWAATLYVEFYPAHVIGNEGWTVTQPMDINPGLNWDITDNFSLNPGLVLYPTKLTFDTTSTILYASYKVF